MWGSNKWQDRQTNSFNNQTLLYFIILNAVFCVLPSRAIPWNHSHLQSTNMILCNTLMKQALNMKRTHWNRASTQLCQSPRRRTSSANSNRLKSFKCCTVELGSLQLTARIRDPKAQQHAHTDEKRITVS